MSGTFEDTSEAEAYAREWLEQQADGGVNGDRPTYSDEVDTNLESINMDIYETLKVMKQQSESVTPDWVMDLHADCMWRACVQWLGESAVAELVEHYLRPSPESELERLIRSVGPGYHPDTPYDGYEPPITHYTEEEWTRIHDAAFEGIDDVYAFGLPIIQEMLEARVTKYRDGSRSDQVVIEEVEDMLDRYGTETDYVLLEVITWSDAARAKFQERFRERWPYS